MILGIICKDSFSTAVLGYICLIHSITSYKMFQSSIPNGANIPHPCDTGRIWNGVGHENSAGAGKRNPFGQDFEHLGKVWGKTLCETDSDGDELTNGQELGDPHCEWSEGQTPKQTTALSHPGICEPLNSAKCQTRNSWLKCDADKFKCDAIKEDGVQDYTIRLPPTKVPANETTYMCMRFKLPTDGDYHIIAEEPIIDNDYVLHHMILFGCEDLGSKCKEILSLWAFGVPGHCGSRHAGYRMGKEGYKYAAIQIHWNNPEKRDDYFDSSGLKLYYTPNLRPNDAGVLTIGQLHLNIPPKMEHHEVTALCDHECSSVLLSSKIYLIEGANYMHYLGKAEKVEVFRNSHWLREITNDPSYIYDSPVLHSYDNPIEIQPGDEFKTTCVYQSLNTNHTTNFGEDTSAEMCFAFISYYPKKNLKDNYCLSWKTLPDCKLNGKMASKFNETNGCDFKNLTVFITGIVERVFKQCNPHTCVPGCFTLVKTFLTNVCYQGDLKDYLIDMSYQLYHSVTDAFFLMIGPCEIFFESCPNCTMESETTIISKQTERQTDQTGKTMTSTQTDPTGTTMTSTQTDRQTDQTGTTMTFAAGESIVSNYVMIFTINSVLIIMINM